MKKIEIGNYTIGHDGRNATISKGSRILDTLPVGTAVLPVAPQQFTDVKAAGLNPANCRRIGRMVVTVEVASAFASIARVYNLAEQRENLVADATDYRDAPFPGSHKAREIKAAQLALAAFDAAHPDLIPSGVAPPAQTGHEGLSP